MKVYIYVTKAKKRYRILHQGFFSDELYRLPNGEIKFGSSVELMAYDNYDKNNFLNGKIVAWFELNEIDLIECDSKQHNYWSKNGSCLSVDDFIDYCNGKDLYAWHIDNLTILDEPLQINKFAKLCKSMKQENKYYIHKAPKSYQYAYYNHEKCLLLSVRSEHAVKILNGEKTIEVRKTKPRF